MPSYVTILEKTGWIVFLEGVKTTLVLGHRVELPLVRCAHAARPDEEMTPERVGRVLRDEETQAVTRDPVVHGSS